MLESYTASRDALETTRYLADTDSLRTWQSLMDSARIVPWGILRDAGVVSDMDRLLDNSLSPEQFAEQFLRMLRMSALEDQS